MSEREDLAREIWRAGTTDPDALAAWLIEHGWGRREAAFRAGIVSTIDAVNSIQSSALRPMIRGSLA